MPELASDLEAAVGVRASPASISRWLIRNGYRFKKCWWPANKNGLISKRRARNGRLFGNRRCGLNRTSWFSWTRPELQRR
jgi:hypothetical protein